MPALVDLTAAPYNLDADQLAWVEDTLASMTLNEQVGQLFTNLFFFGADSFCGNPYTGDEIVEKFHVGIARYHGGTAEKVQGACSTACRRRPESRCIAANCDSGGNAAMSDGTYIASGAQTEASGSIQVAHDAGLVSGWEMRAIGVNLNSDPCVDILFNWRNTIVNTRAYGTNATDVVKYTIPFVEGQRESGVLSCIKHWPARPCRPRKSEGTGRPCGCGGRSPYRGRGANGTADRPPMMPRVRRRTPPTRGRVRGADRPRRACR